MHTVASLFCHDANVYSKVLTNPSQHLTIVRVVAHYTNSTLETHLQGPSCGPLWCGTGPQCREDFHQGQGSESLITLSGSGEDWYSTKKKNKLIFSFSSVWKIIENDDYSSTQILMQRQFILNFFNNSFASMIASCQNQQTVTATIQASGSTEMKRSLSGINAAVRTSTTLFFFASSTGPQLISEDYSHLNPLNGQPASVDSDLKQPSPPARIQKRRWLLSFDQTIVLATHLVSS